jgi:hypothetical protein
MKLVKKIHESFGIYLQEDVKRNQIKPGNQAYEKNECPCKIPIPHPFRDII